MKALICDTETGGLNADTTSLLSIGWVILDLDTGEELDMQEYYVRLDSVDEYRINPKAIEVHGITAEKCMDEGIPAEDIRDKLLDAYMEHNCGCVGGHNFSHDIPFIEKHLLEGEAFKSVFDYHILDSFPPLMLLAGSMFQSGHTVGQAIKAFKIDMSDLRGGFHGALYDAVATARILCRLRKLLLFAREKEKNGELQV